MRRILKNIARLALTLSMTVSVCACGLASSGLTESTGRDYETIYDVDGAVFGMPKQFLKVATAITEISDNSDFSDENIYLYKDGESKYLFFGMQQIVVAVEKNTAFHFTTTKNKEEALDNSSILGIWMNSTEKKGLSYSEENSGDIYKLIATVDAQVVITKNLYGDFVGKLASITTDKGEWSMFVGVPGSDYKNDVTSEQKKYIEAISKSLTSGKKVEETYFEVGTSSDTETAAADDEAKETAKAAEKVATKSVAVKTTKAANVTETENTSSESIEGSETAGAPTSVAETTVNPMETAQAETSEAETTAEAETEPLETVRENESRPEKGDMQGMHMVNQHKAKADTSGISDSSIYSFLSFGQKGSLQTLSDENTAVEGMAITYDKIYTGDEATALIEDFCASGEAGYNYTAPPVGTSWVVCEYTLDYLDLNDRPYVDIKALGPDGQPIRHAGIEYKDSMRTYEITNHKKEDGSVVSGLMVYFPLPANTKEFVLAAGNGATNKHYKGAFLLVKI